MHVNTIYLKDNNLWVSYDLEIVNENICLNATFVRDGEQIHKIHKLGTFDMLCELKDKDFAIAKAKELIESANRSAHSPFLK